MAPSISSTTTHYALVIDAGSSGSRLQIYSWRDPDLERAEILNEVAQAQASRGQDEKKWWWMRHDWKGKGKQREDEMQRTALRRLVRVGKGVEGEAWVKRVEPGISSIAPSDIPNYLSPLLSHALQQIPPSQHSSTPIYLLATAGMRLLPDSTRQQTLQAACDMIRNEYPFMVEGPSSAGPCGDSVRVISGEEEGMWGWVAVNYLMDGFGHAPDASKSGTATDGEPTALLPLAPLADPPPDSSSDSVTPVDVNHHSPTFGFLDMGGASTQLAFSPTELELAKSAFPRDELHRVSLRLLSGEEVEWPVFVASWLGFGTNRARDRYAESLLSAWRASQPTTALPDLLTPIPDPCLPTDLLVPSSNPTSHPPFLGTGSFSTCLTNLRPLLDHSAPCPTEHCLFGGISTPHIDFQREDQRGFIGISEYWYTAQQVLGLGGVWDWGEWEKGMSEYCGRSWSDIEVQVVDEMDGRHDATADLARLQMQCFKGAWVSNVLHEGIGIPRLVDSGGNDTLTGGSLGDTNAEAERRARRKGLQNPHFQSMDEVGETAISWTLGKMVIEASKAVAPRSAAVEKAWSDRLGTGVGLGRLEEKMQDMGIQALWAYAFILFVILSCLATAIRRRRATSPRRTRKRSVSGDNPFQTGTNGGIFSWLIKPFYLFSWSKVKDDGYSSGYSSLEEGYDYPTTTTATSSKSTRATIGRLRLWSRRITNYLRRGIDPYRHLPTRNHRHMSLPLTSTSYHHQSTTLFQPSMIQEGGFFSNQNSNGSLTVPSTRPPSTSPESRTAQASSTSLSSSPGPSLTTSTSSSSASPPRNLKISTGASRPFKSRQDSLSLLSPPERDRAQSGWNDPPLSMLPMNPYGIATTSTIGGYDLNGDPSPSGILTPTATGRGFEHALSRNSSRVNLSELGLAQRNASRCATPSLG
ncbi:nucleoside phosphatase family-domain-containing protein [Naematelia encephala]|uniref:Nucleoside phosphatase family-domain-containing protein n=1 Tax=Naematelia encephala TaxID=71784 RepID=A0A1Y2BG87_9TREE|nr:nucleoside phosphatase family-domain-containing protein [Naematelia encephala]